MHRTRTTTLLIVALLAVAPAVRGLPADARSEADSAVRGRWERLPLPIEKDSQIRDMAMEPGGTLWLLASRDLFYWDGNRFRPAAGAGDHLTGSTYLDLLFGGQDRPVYVTQLGDREHWGKVYALADGEARYVTDFYFDDRGEDLGLYVSKTGRLFNWGKRFIATYSESGWTRIEAKLRVRDTCVFEAARAVHFYYNGKLYSADVDGRWSVVDVPCPFQSVPGQRRVHGCLWGDTTMMLLECGYRGVFAYDLVTHTPVPTDSINAALGEREVYDVFRAGDGSAWVLLNDRALQGYVFVRVSPAGQVTTIAPTADLPWDNARCWQFPKSVLNAADGSIWFGAPKAAMARYRDGRLRIFGWQDGLQIGSANHLCEDARGDIYAASARALFAFRTRQPASEPGAAAKLWDEHVLTTSRLIRDGAGNVWMFMKERPRFASRWDGAQWRHIPVPFDPSQGIRALGDDRSHILIEVPEPTGATGWYDIGLDGVKAYSSREDMLVGAMRDGARRFEAGPDYQGCYVVDGTKMWYGLHNYPWFSYFDGTTWDKFSMAHDVDYMYESPKRGIIVQTQGLKYYAYDRGQITEIEAPAGPRTRWLLGPRRLQPFEPELPRLHPELYTPVERQADGKYYLLRADPGQPGTSYQPTHGLGDALPQYLKTLTPSPFGGYWTDYGSSGPYRIFAGRVLRCDFSDSPLAESEHDIRSIVEDRAHNLWIDAGWYAGGRHVFVRRLTDFRIRARGIPAKVTDSLRMTVEPLLPGLEASRTRLFWRFVDGPWLGGEPGPQLTIPFPASGRYRVELMGMDPMGGTSKPLTFAVTAEVRLPETKLTAPGPYLVKDVVWEAPALAVPSASGGAAELAYRVDGGEWRIARHGKVVFGGLEPGEHLVEIAAKEGAHRDPTPLRLTVTYAPDFDFIVASRLDIIAGPDLDRSKEALEEIHLAGPAVVPILEKRLAEAHTAATLTGALETLLRRLEQGEK